MLRRFSGILVLVLLTPWLVALSATAAPIVPCPMHRGSSLHTEYPGLAGQMAHGHGVGDRSKDSDHGTTRHGCGCAGECDKSGSHKVVLAPGSIPASSRARGASLEFGNHYVAVWTADLQPPSTGPPVRLRS